MGRGPGVLPARGWACLSQRLPVGTLARAQPAWEKRRNAKSATSSQVQDHLPAVTGPRGVRGDGGACRAGRASLPVLREERSLCPQASLFPSLLLVV